MGKYFEVSECHTEEIFDALKDAVNEMKSDNDAVMEFFSLVSEMVETAMPLFSASLNTGVGQTYHEFQEMNTVLIEKTTELKVENDTDKEDLQVIADYLGDWEERMEYKAAQNSWSEWGQEKLFKQLTGEESRLKSMEPIKVIRKNLEDLCK